MKIVALAGGVGGAKLVDGFAQILSPENLTIIVNTGDDFEHLGLFISPDLDTVCYTLAHLSNQKTGWGRRDETFHALENIRRLGGPDWFHLGDRDLATHLERTRRMQSGEPLSQITRAFCHSWDVHQLVLPMCDQPVRTMVDTVDNGQLAFQEYFVHRKCDPKVKGFQYTGIDKAIPSPGVLEAILHADTIVICPSNPWVSIDPILAVAGIRSALALKMVIAVSPIISGVTFRGPAAKMYTEMGIQPSSLAVANHYGKILSGFVLDHADKNLVPSIPVYTRVTNILMKDHNGRQYLAQDVLNLIETLRNTFS